MSTSARAIPTLVWILWLLLPGPAWATLYVKPAGPPYDFSNGSLTGAVSYVPVDSAVYTDPTFVAMAQSYDLVAFKLALTAESPDLYIVDAEVLTTPAYPYPGPFFVAGSPNSPSSAGTGDYFAIYVLPHPVVREADGSIETPTFVLRYPIGILPEDPAAFLYIQGVFYGTTPLGFAISPRLPAPEPSLTALGSLAAALALRRHRSSNKMS